MAETWKRILNSDLLRHAPPINGAIEGLFALNKHEVWLVTSRPHSMERITLSWLHENKASYDHIVFGMRGNKLSVGPRFDIFVEDFIEEASVIAETGIFTILFNQPWNNNSELPKNCVRAFDWNSILLLINDYERSTRGYARD